MCLVYKKYYIFPFFKFFYYLFNPVLKHPPEYSACHNRIHLKIDNLFFPQSLRHLVGLKFYPHGKPLNYGCLADPGFADYHNRIAPLHMAEDLHHLVYFVFPSNDGRKLIVIGEFVKIDSKVLEVRRQFVLLF